jgi:pSer/pThr/pTyr-binding forkhead associated (FHA) protein
MGSQGDFKLIVKQGPSPDQEFALRDGETLIGRDNSHDMDIVIPSPAVSRLHAKISREGDVFMLHDLGSSNGTYLNGLRLDEHPKQLNAGDEIGLGGSITLIFEGPHPSSTPPKESGARDPQASAETVLADDFDSLKPLPAAQLTVTIAGEVADVYTLDRDMITIGRADDNAIVIASKIVSRYHARLERVDGGHQFTALPKASNPVYLGGNQLAGTRRLEHGDILRIGSVDR